MLLRRFAVGVLLLALGIPGSARADTGSENVTVQFGVSVLVLGEQHASTKAACQLSMAPDADGFDLLDAAVAKGCITSYATSHFDGGNGITRHRVSCIDGVCDGRIPSSGPGVRGRWGSDPHALELFEASRQREFVPYYEFTVLI